MSEQKTQERPKLTKEQVEARKAEMTAWHKEQIPFLETQFNYEDLLTKIQESITNRLEAEYKWIQLTHAMKEKMEEAMAQSTGNMSESEGTAPMASNPNLTATRTLKKEQE